MRLQAALSPVLKRRRAAIDAVGSLRRFSRQAYRTGRPEPRFECDRCRTREPSFLIARPGCSSAFNGFSARWLPQIIRS